MDGEALMHAEAMLFVDHRQAEILEVYPLLKEGVGAHQYVDLPGLKPVEDSLDDKKRLIPWVDEDIVSNVDLAAGVVTVNWAEDY